MPADLPLSELETRLAERLRTEFDLADVAVEIDDRGRAHVAAAPPSGALSRRVPDGHRAVSVDGLVPTGMTRGESLAVGVDGTTVEGTLLSARSGGSPSPPPGAPETDDGEQTPPDASAALAPTTDGGEGRVTVAAPRRDANALLAADRGRVVVRSRGTRREFELLGLLRRAGKHIARTSVRSDGALDGTTLGEAGVCDAYRVAVLAVRRSAGQPEEPRQWVFSPRGDVRLSAGDELFVVGARDPLARFRGAVA